MYLLDKVESLLFIVGHLRSEYIPTNIVNNFSIFYPTRL